jgi:hypothetical protein
VLLESFRGIEVLAYRLNLRRHRFQRTHGLGIIFESFENGGVYFPGLRGDTLAAGFLYWFIVVAYFTIKV